MCTVTVIRSDDGFIVTSNRDENPERAVHHEPVTDKRNNTLLLFPKDPFAGGSWFVANEHKAIGVLLNGAFENHVRLKEYRLSRGLILLQVMSNTNPEGALHDIDLNLIEPFTLVLLIEHRLLAFRWDGNEKHFQNLDPNLPHIFSSVTLYNQAVRTKREQLFSDFLSQNKAIDQHAMIKFHSMDLGDKMNGFVMQRSEMLRTLSTTQAVVSGNSTQMNHYDMLNNQRYNVSIEFATSNQSLN